MPVAPLIVTKLCAPTDSGQWLARERLLADLAARHRGRRCRACVISAGPGFGKTTLAAQWGASLARAGQAVSWLTLEPDDDSPDRLCAYLLAAIQRAQPAVDLGLASLLDDRAPDAPARVLTAIINAVASGSSRVTLVLDDCHHIADARARELLRLLVARSPENLHLVLATRPPPPIPLGVLRAHDELTEIDAAALRFDVEESELFLNHRQHLGIGTDGVREICARTEGWPAALRLVSLSLGGRPRGGSRHAVLGGVAGGTLRALTDYLAENVLDRLDARWLRFLLATSILDRLCADLCDAVTGAPGSQELLDATERAGLFLIALDGERRWFRYHHLFAEILRHRLTATPELSPRDLHLAASDWFASQALIEEAVGHALAAGERRRAAELLERDGMLLVEQGRMSLLLGLADKLPPAEVAERPALQLALLWAKSVLHAPDAAAVAAMPAPTDAALAAELDLIRAINAGFQDDIDAQAALLARARPQLAPHPWLLGVAAIVEGFVELSRHRFAAARAALLAGRAFQDRVRGTLSAVYSCCFEGLALAYGGDLDGAARAFERGLAIATEGGGRHGYSARMVSAYLGEIRYEQDQLGPARELLEAGFSLRDETCAAEMALAVYPALARLHEAAGDHDAALAVLYEGARQAAAQRLDRVAAAVEHEEVRLHLAAGDVERAARCLGAANEEPPVGRRQAWELRRLARGRILLAQGRPAAARALLPPLVEAAVADGRRRFELAVRLVAAVAAQAEADAEAARAELGAALALGEAQGAIRSFVDEGRVVEALLRRWPTSGSGHVARLLAAFRPAAAPARGVSAKPALIEPLNVRELQILRLIEEGRANKDVSAALGIGLDTVKWHLKNAYRKLGAASRTGAIHAARAAGVLGANLPPPRLKAPHQARK